MDLSIDLNGCKKRWKNHNVKRTEKVLPLITGEIAFCQQVRELVFGVNAVDFGFWAKLILSNDQSRATLWARDTSLIVGRQPLMIILITASLPSKNLKHGFEVTRFCACDDVIHIGYLIIISVSLCLRFCIGVGVLGLDFVLQRVLPCRNVKRIMQHF